MLKTIGWTAASLAAVLALWAGWVSWRVLDQRGKAAAAVEAILERADPSIDAISGARLEMLLRVEDPTFWVNDGIDMRSPGAGGTTLSQALGKLIFFERYKAGLAKQGKLELMALTRFALVPTVSRQDILRAMLASAYMGSDERGAVVGFPEAARRWHGKEIGALSDDEFIALVAMLRAPNRLDPRRHPAESAERVTRIKRLLAGDCAPLGAMDDALEGCAA